MRIVAASQCPRETLLDIQTAKYATVPLFHLPHLLLPLFLLFLSAQIQVYIIEIYLH